MKISRNNKIEHFLIWSAWKPYYMDLMCIDVIIDKMAVLVWGLHHVFIHTN